MSQNQWVMAKHHAIVDREIVNLVERRVPERILICQEPPRHGKSEHLSHYTPAWFHLRYPDRNSILLGYGAEFASKWGRKARDTWQEMAPYHGLAPNKDKWGAKEWVIDHYGGSMRTSGIGGSITGHGAHLLLIDDPVKNDKDAQSETFLDNLWQWWQATVFTRLEPGGVAVIMQTRWAKNDLAGRLIAASESGEGEPVRVVDLPAIALENDQMGREPGEALWPARWPVEELEKIRRVLAAYWWLALYQQTPTQHGDAEWPDSYFKETIWSDTRPEKYQWNVISIDASKGRTEKSDYSAIVRVGWSREKYWVDSSVRRRPMEQIAKDAALWVQEEMPDVVYIEGNFGGDMLATLIQREIADLGMPAIAIAVEDSTEPKENRIRRLGPRLREDQYRFLRTTDNTRLVDQLRQFPIGDFDDGPDALEMATRALLEVAAIKTQGEQQAEDILAGRGS